MKIMPMNLVEVKPELRANLLSKVLLQVSYLTCIFDKETYAVSNIPFLRFCVLVMLEKVRISS